MKTTSRALHGLMFFLIGIFTWLNASAQTSYTSGVSYTSGNSATLWFKPNSPTDWVDAHYNTGTGQQNNRMALNAGTGRYEQTVSATVGASVSYSFTYAINGLAYDTPTATVIVGPSSSASSIPSSMSSVATSASSVRSSVASSVSSLASSSSSAATGVSYGAQDNSSTIILWLKPNTTNVSWADIHYNIMNTGLQNVRTTYNASLGRYEMAVTVSPSTNPLSINYSFTYQTPTGAYDSANFVFNRTASSSSSMLSSASVASSITSSNQSSAVSSVVTSSSIRSSSSSVASSVVSSTSSSTAAFVQGVSKLGSTATIWFRAPTTQQYVILHYSVGTGSQNNPQMILNSSLNRWEAVINPVATGDTIHYNFTYQGPSGGNLDSAWFNYTLVDGVCKVNYSPMGGSFFSAQNIVLSPSEAGSVVRYTLDGSAPNPTSPTYNAPIGVTNAATINAIAIKADGTESDLCSQTYAINKVPGTLNPPAFSLASGSYNSLIRVSLSSEQAGAFIRYTTDGSTPTINSPIYTGPIEVKIDTTKNPIVNTTNIKAISTKAGWTTSAVNSATYTITSNTTSSWNGLTTFKMVNGTKGKYPDSQVYWAIIGKDWNTDQFVHVDMNGNLVSMSLGDNGQLVKNGKPYANYFYSLAQTKQITIPAINSARLLMSVGSPMYIWVNTDGNGKTAYAGANVENPTDPNIDVIFDFAEFAIVAKNEPYQGIFINTTRVDLFGFPVQLTAQGLDGFTQTVGEPLTESRDELFARFNAETPAEFHNLSLAPYAPYRIMAPAHASFQTGGNNAAYLDDYISTVWEQYRHQNLTLNLNNGWPTFTGHVEGDAFIFTDGLGTYRIYGKPTTAMAMLGNGYLDDPTGTLPKTPEHDKQLQLQAQVCAALNRRVAHLVGSQWYNADNFFPAGERANYFTKFWHDHALNGLTYGFSYDDVGGYSPSIYTPSPTNISVTVGW